MGQRIYFGHPMNTYGTPLERALLTVIDHAFPDWEIENPNQEHHQDGCRRWEVSTGNPMEYFFYEVLPHCHAGIFLPFRDGRWGAGVFGEAKVLLGQLRPIWKINPEGVMSSVRILDDDLRLSIEETKSRILTASNEWIPY